MAQGYSLHPDGTLAEHTVTNTRAYTEIDGLDDGRTMFAIASFEGVLNFTAGTALLPQRSASAPTSCRRLVWSVFSK